MVNETDTGVPETVLQERYAVGEVLGRGGMGTVYRGTDLVLDREVALKIFRADVADADELLRQQSEIRLLARLNHHGLVTLFDAGTAAWDRQEVPFLVMELIQGSDLHRRLRAGVLPGKEAARLGAELADALQYIHRHGVVHRDVKPANILLARYAEDAELRPKLADFGIARMLDDARLTATNTTPGTAAYLSPEQASGASVGPPTDIYSLGLVLLEALTGKAEFSGSPLEAAVARLSRDPEIPDALGSSWKALLESMTAREPSARPDAGRVAEALRGGADWSVRVVPAAAGVPASLPQQTLFLNAASAPGRSAAGAARGGAGNILPALPDSEATNVSSWQPLPPSRRPVSAAQASEPPWILRLGLSLRDSLRLRGRRLWLILGLLAVAAVIAGAVLLGGLQRPAPMPANTPGPAIPGPLGEHFSELEESVRP